MTEQLIPAMQKAAFEAERDNRKVTHWLMTDKAFDRLRYEATADRLYVPCKNGPALFMGLPIYLTHALEDTAFLLGEGDPPDETMERELRRQLHMLRYEYQERVEPIIKQLTEIENRKPPIAHFIVLSHLAAKAR